MWTLKTATETEETLASPGSQRLSSCSRMKWWTDCCDQLFPGFESCKKVSQIGGLLPRIKTANANFVRKWIFEFRSQLAKYWCCGIVGRVGLYSTESVWERPFVFLIKWTFFKKGIATDWIKPFGGWRQYWVEIQTHSWGVCRRCTS